MCLPSKIVPSPAKSPASTERIEKMLNSLKGKVVTFWLPPKSYPSFLGLLSVLPSRARTNLLRVKHYIFMKQALNSGLFEKIVLYLRKEKALGP